jgi:hypothetical protein
LPRARWGKGCSQWCREQEKQAEQETNGYVNLSAP